jgi:molecular chaperone DnaK
VRFEIRGKPYAPEEISALILRKLAEDAAKFLGERVSRMTADDIGSARADGCRRIGAEHQVTISETTNLNQGEVERMIREAEQHAEEDRRRREEIDARNELDTLAYRVEQLVNELQDRLPVHEKARAEQLDADARQAVHEQAGLDRVGPLIADAQQLVRALPASAAAAAPAGDGAGAEAETADDEEIVDPEFTRE